MNDFAQRSNDRIILLKLVQANPPSSYDKIMLGALMMRYRNDPSFYPDIEIAIRTYRLTPPELFRQCREIWANGFRPQDLSTDGSAWDSVNKEENQ